MHVFQPCGASTCFAFPGTNISGSPRSFYGRSLSENMRKCKTFRSSNRNNFLQYKNNSSVTVTAARLPYRPRVKAAEKSPSPKDEAQRLQKVLAQMGVASRREAEKLIENGCVKVNNRKVRQQGLLVKVGEDTIHVNGKMITPPKPIWIAIHKPKGILSIPGIGGRSVDTFIPTAKKKGLVAIGGIGEEASGLVILSNDRAAAAQLNSPENMHIKEWFVDCRGPVSFSKVRELKHGTTIDDEGNRFAPESVQCLGTERIELSPRQIATLTRFQVGIRENRRQLVQRLFASAGLKVVNMSRRAFGPVLLSSLKRGDFRYLTPNEIKALKRGVKKSKSPNERTRERVRKQIE